MSVQETKAQDPIQLNEIKAPNPQTQSPLAILKNAPNIYMTVHFNKFPYLVSPNDTIHLPVKLPDAPVGSILKMTYVSRIGSRDYTLLGKPYIDPNIFTLKMRVLEHTKAPLVVTKKKRQRHRRTRHLFNKQNYTVVKYESKLFHF
jgi:large subunit ribosomal protein L21